MKKRCFFIGHRDAPESICPALCDAVEQHIVEYGVTEFMIGNYGSFDHMACRAVAQMKERYPQIRLTLLLAYPPVKMNKPSGVDELYYPEGLEATPRRYAIVRANQKAVDLCDYLIPYVWQTASSAQKLLEDAQGRLQITSLRRSFLLYQKRKIR